MSFSTDVPTIAFIDHYDSFSFNVIDWLVGASEKISIKHIYYDRLDAIEDIKRRPCPLVLSPGPHSPSSYPTTKDLVSSVMGKVPILGVCLGHQIIGEVLGAEIIRCRDPLHGQTRDIHLAEPGRLFVGMPPIFKGMSYNSLTIDRDSAERAGLRITGLCESEEVQAMEFERGDVRSFGLQYHPESFKSEHQDVVLTNWLREAGRFWDL